MLKLTMCVKRQPGRSRAEFDEHWRNQHAALIRKHAALLGIRKYVQTTPLANPTAQHALQQSRGAEPVDFDGCAELWWDDLESHLAARGSAQGRMALQELIEDERRFVDLAKSQMWYGLEREIV
ncbi:EthD domain-containing protein [Pseudomonas sp. MWU16-30317]|uniref:EthD domain-containing protein n=1 Tax=Pseudomonas sp. MWU16-30317 TaxID=2878095 RepID=UPI001CFA701E|nr:EthD domain-containing protein [Pseudomonas sp. MWU16-30317]